VAKTSFVRGCKAWMEGERQRALVVIRRMDERLHVVGGMIWQSLQIRWFDALGKNTMIKDKDVRRRRARG
jgi:hypothetical protein